MQWCSKIRNVPSEVRTALCPASERYLPQAKPDRPPPITTTVFALACETHNKKWKKLSSNVFDIPSGLRLFERGHPGSSDAFSADCLVSLPVVSSEPGHSEPWVFPTALWLRRSWPFPQCPWASGSPAHWSHWTMKNIRMPTSNSMIARNYPSSGTTHSPVPGLTVLNAKSSRKRTVSGRISSVAKFHRDHVGYRIHQDTYWFTGESFLTISVSQRDHYDHFPDNFRSDLFSIFRSAVWPGWRSQSSTWAAELPTRTWAWHSEWSSLFHTQNAKQIKELMDINGK